MTHAELLRIHADLAIKEGGMYYSGEYLNGIATVAESLEAENAKLREKIKALTELASIGKLTASQCTELAEDNAKLRELVREIWKSCPVSEDDCVKCSHRMEEDDEVWCDIPILMEQLGVLGIEVDA